MKYKPLDYVVLIHDLPEHELCAGDLGTVIGVYKPDGIEVEFIKASGETLAVVTLSHDDVRAVGSQDIISVRSLRHAA